MKRMGVISIFTVLILMFGVSNAVFAGGIEPGDQPDDCDCLSVCGEPEGIDKPPPYPRGTFTAAYAPGDSTQIVFHLFLRWGNKVLLVPRFTVAPATPLCDMDEVFLIGAIYQNYLLCNNEIKYLIGEQFGLEGTPLIKNLVITDRGGCEPGNTLPSDDIIRGEITISVVPFIECDPISCYE